jgi:hypothetical protein
MLQDWGVETQGRLMSFFAISISFYLRPGENTLDGP